MPQPPPANEVIKLLGVGDLPAAATGCWTRSSCRDLRREAGNSNSLRNETVTAVYRVVPDSSTMLPCPEHSRIYITKLRGSNTSLIIYIASAVVA